MYGLELSNSTIKWNSDFIIVKFGTEHRTESNNLFCNLKCKTRPTCNAYMYTINVLNYLMYLVGLTDPALVRLDVDTKLSDQLKVNVLSYPVRLNIM